MDLDLVGITNMDILFKAASRWFKSSTFDLDVCAMLVKEMMVHDELVMKPCGAQPVVAWYHDSQYILPICAAHLKVADPEKWSAKKGWTEVTRDGAEVFLVMRS